LQNGDIEMASKQVNGSAVTNTSTRNNSGVVRRGGNIASTKFVAQNELGAADDMYASGVKMTNLSGLAKSVSAGTFAVMEKGSYIIRKVTSTLAGVANTVLKSGGSDFGNRNAIHKIENVRGTFLSGLSWAKDHDGQPTYIFTKSETYTALGNDNAARPSLAVPGELVYVVGKTPVQDDYKAKTSA
jgi:hypothetical protein